MNGQLIYGERHVDYLKHLKINIKAALKCFMLIFFHLVHGILPIKLTEHKRWGIGKEE